MFKIPFSSVLQTNQNTFVKGSSSITLKLTDQLHCIAFHSPLSLI